MASIESISAAFDFVSTVKPKNKKMIKVIAKEGIVVYAMYFICVNKSVPAIAGARFVVSDKGDILSPKYAPEITAPAAIPEGIPMVFPIPINATPTVAAVVHELPVAIEIMAQTIHEATKKKVGLIISNP